MKTPPIVSLLRKQTSQWPKNGRQPQHDLRTWLGGNPTANSYSVRRKHRRDCNTVKNTFFNPLFHIGLTLFESRAERVSR